MFACIGIAILIAAYCIIPSVGRSIDRASPSDTVSVGAQYQDSDGHNLSLGFNGTKIRTNEKDHPTVGAADGHVKD